MGVTVARGIRFAAHGPAYDGSSIAILVRPEEGIQRPALVFCREHLLALRHLVQCHGETHTFMSVLVRFIFCNRGNMQV
jgi:hypothetical protein